MNNSGIVKRRILRLRRATLNIRSVYRNKKLIIRQNGKIFYEPEKSNARGRQQKPSKGMRTAELEIKSELDGSYGHFEGNIFKGFYCN